MVPAAAAAEGSAFVLGLALIAAGLALLPVLWVAAARVFPEHQGCFARWGFSHVLVAALVLLTAMQAATYLPGEGTGALLLHQTLAWLPAVGYLLWVAVRLDPAGSRALGLDPTRAAAAAALGLLFLLGLLPVLWGAQVAWPALCEWLDIGPPPEDLGRSIAALEGGALWAGLLIAVVVIPFFEELAFRGFLQPLLVQNVGPLAGVVLTSFVFAALHGAYAFGTIFVLSLILGAAMWRTRRLLSPWLVHAVYNAVGLAIWIHFPEVLGA